VYFYSDGLVDLRDRDGEWLPQEMLGDAIAVTSGLPIAEGLTAVVRRLQASSGKGSFEDDVTLIGLERRRA
jgi:serine phosphatase RsbU (regulator of sigma subunit)